METIKRAGFIAGVMFLGCGAVHADDYDWEDIFAPYRQRIDTATTSSGDAQNVNAATQIITPWPRNVLNRRIPGDGSRMVEAVKAYREPRAHSDTTQPRSQPSPAASGGDPLGAMDPAKAGGAGQSERPKQ